MNQIGEVLQRVNALEKLLQLELASADLMDALLVEWASNMRTMSRHNIALENVLSEILFFCETAGINLGDLKEKAEAVLDCDF